MRDPTFVAPGSNQAPTQQVQSPPFPWLCDHPKATKSHNPGKTLQQVEGLKSPPPHVSSAVQQVG